MMTPSYVLLYVDSPESSAAFYSKILGLTPVEASPTFYLFILDSGHKLGLWSKHTVEPAATSSGGSELAFAVGDNATVDSTYNSWAARGITMAQTPCSMDFGYTFVAQDPDGHRLRVFAPA
ncbi:VOC family protein [Undibacterium umbellatum]|uniref:VOC family protein n=1 Tax=Undibacterium umbellatum TaxID=2762300 RepID=A0ABR6ZDK9_9BURK|nr:VOC family protein [Undibacterium umbellatum]MBC3909832.1 VOC family protein [Undibacterium umbellatum]